MSNYLYKQVDELTLADLQKFPVWEFISEDDPHAADECTVKGYEKEWEKVKGEFFIRTKFILNDGTVHFGHVKPERSLSSSQPVILIGNNKVLLWHGVMKPTRTTIVRFYRYLIKQLARCSRLPDIQKLNWETLK